MIKHNVVDANTNAVLADGSSVDENPLLSTTGTLITARFFNNNFKDLHDTLKNTGYSMILDDYSTMSKALKLDYNDTYIYNTNNTAVAQTNPIDYWSPTGQFYAFATGETPIAIATNPASEFQGLITAGTINIISQMKKDVVRGSDGKYYEAQADGTTGDNPVGSTTGNWTQVGFDAGAGALDATQKYAIDSGSVNSLILTYANVDTLNDKTLLFFQTPNQNTGASTLVVNSFASKAIVINNVALVGGEISANKPFAVRYNTTNDNYELITFGVDEDAIKETLNATGNAPLYACRAWVNFNGTGAVAIRGSGNVSSITDNGVGNYTVNFTTAMPDINSSVTGMSSTATENIAETRGGNMVIQSLNNTTSVRIITSRNGDNGAAPVYMDYVFNCVSITR